MMMCSFGPFPSVSRAWSCAKSMEWLAIFRGIQIVSFWLVRKGMKGAGGRWNALRHRHHRAQNNACQLGAGYGRSPLLFPSIPILGGDA